LFADRRYDADWISVFAGEHDAWADIPTKRNRKNPIYFSSCLCRERSLFNEIKQGRRVATWYHSDLAALLSPYPTSPSPLIHRLHSLLRSSLNLEEASEICERWLRDSVCPGLCDGVQRMAKSAWAGMARTADSVAGIAVLSIRFPRHCRKSQRLIGLRSCRGKGSAKINLILTLGPLYFLDDLPH
jgi:hypothetical protein